MFYKQNGIVAGILLLILFAGAIGLAVYRWTRR